MQITELNMDLNCLIKASSEKNLTEEQINLIKLQIEMKINSLLGIDILRAPVSVSFRVHIKDD